MPRSALPELMMGALIGGVVVHTAHTARNQAQSTYQSAVDWCYNPTPLRGDELKKYADLKKAYKAMGLDDIPPIWTLSEDNRPNLNMNYETVISCVNDLIDEYETYGTPVIYARINILTLLVKYLESVRKRNAIVDRVIGAHERIDGIESMFLAEFISWFCERVPQMPEHGEKTLNVFNTRLTYCKTIYSDLSRHHWHNEERANFKDLMKKLNEHMQEYCNNLTCQRKMMQFNDEVEQLKNELTALERYLINFLYSLIDGATGILLIKNFMNPLPSEPKLKAIRETGLGNFLYQSIRASNINCLTYEPSAKIKKQRLNTHLNDQHPSDEFCSLRDALRNADAIAWGHRPFVLQDNRTISTHFATTTTNPLMIEASTVEVATTDKAASYLEKIRTFNRFIVKIGFFYQNLERLKLSSTVYGTTWVYGNPAGKAVLEELLKSIKQDLAIYKQDFNEFWSQYYEKDYLAYEKKVRLNITDPGHASLTKTNKSMSIHEKILTNITLTIQKIQLNATTLPDIEKSANENLGALFSDVLFMMGTCSEKLNHDNYRAIQEALVQLETNTNNMPETLFLTRSEQDNTEKLILPEVTKVYEIILPKRSLPFYCKGIALLARTSTTSTNAVLTNCPENSIPSIQKIYDNYLHRYHDEVINFYPHMMSLAMNNPASWFTCSYAWLATRRQIPWDKITNFRTTYLNVLDVFSSLFATQPSNEDTAPLEIEILLLADAMQKTIYKDHKDNQYFPTLCIDTACMTVKQHEDKIFIKVDDNFVSTSQSILAASILVHGNILREKDAQITKHAREITQCNASIAEKKRELTEKDREITKKDGEITKKDGEITKKDGEITKRDAEIIKRDAEIKKRDVEITNKIRELEERQEIIDALRNMLNPEGLSNSAAPTSTFFPS